MKNFLLLSTLIFTISGQAQETGKLLFFQTDWGRQVTWDVFCERTKASGYYGIETWFPSDSGIQNELKSALEKHGLKIAFLHGTDKSLPFSESLKAYTEGFKDLLAWSPAYINCHTGSDFFSFEQNKSFIEAAIRVAKKSNIPIYHETHRGRFSYNLPDTNKYVAAIAELKLTLDISHWMVVHESLLQRQNELLVEIVSRSHHIHARVGHAEGPQVSDPEAPEWKDALERHLDIWEKVIRQQWKDHDSFTITTEFGPADYMPTLPYTRLPVADQWKANVYMMTKIKQRMGLGEN